MKILWVSNPPTVGSGYGMQTSLFVPRLIEAGYDVALHATWGVQGGITEWNGVKVYPADGDWGNKTIAACAADHADGDLEDCLVFVLADTYIYRTSRFLPGMRFAFWSPIDQSPMPLPTRHVLSHPASIPVAMSQFGVQEMKAAGLDPLYSPHAVDTDLFYPPTDRERMKLRERFGMPADAFVVGMVGANNSHPLLSRKGWPEGFRAFANFRYEHPDAILYVHSNPLAEEATRGLNLAPVAQSCGIPRKAIKIVDAFKWDMGVSHAEVAALLGCFDVLLHPSYGEGFGVVQIEAQACGVRVIATDWTSMRELSGPHGLLVDGQEYYHAPGDSWYMAPRIRSLTAALEMAYAERGEWQQIREESRAFAEGYSAERVWAEHWPGLLASLEQPRQREVGAL